MFRLSNRYTAFISYMLVFVMILGSLTISIPSLARAADLQTEAFIATEDTFAYRDSNNAASQSLIARYNGGGYERISYIKFDMSNLAGGSVESAKFKVYLVRTEDVGDVGVYGLYDNNWTEATVHEKNGDGSYKRPVEINKFPIGSYAFNTAGSNPVNAWLEFDVKDYINSRLQAGFTTVTIMLKNFSYTEAPSTAGQGFAYFASSESVHKPNMEVSYSPQGEPVVLQKPGGMKAIEVSDRSVSFSWEEVPYAVTYAVYRSELENTGYIELGNVNENQYMDNTVNDDTLYFYKIRAVRDHAVSDWSDPWFVTTLRTIGPGDEVTQTFAATDDSYINQANENAAINFGNRQEMIVRHNSGFWKRVSYMKFDMGELVGVTSTRKAVLRLYLRDVQSGGSMVGLYAIHDNTWDELEITAYNPPNEEGKELIGSLNALANIPVHTWYEVDITDYVNKKFGNYEKELSFMLLGGLDAQRTQGYAYFATKESGNAPGLVIDYVIPDEIPPLETPQPSIHELTGTHVTLTWPIIHGAAAYQVYRKAESELNFSMITGRKHNTNGNVYFQDTGVEFGTHYEYRVDATGPDQEKLSSDILTARTPDLILEAPTELQVTVNKGYALGLSWEPVVFAASYELFRSLHPDSGFESVIEAAGTYYEDTGLELDTTYFYKLKAKRNQYESPLSEAVMFRTEKYATTIRGNVKLEASSTYNDIVVKLMDGNETVKTVLTDANGDFIIYGVPDGEFNLEYHTVKYLKKITKNVVINSTDLNLGDQGELKIGDLNGDAVINIRDLRLIAAAYGNSSNFIDFNPLVDLNRDNQINQADIDLLKKNYLASAQ